MTAPDVQACGEGPWTVVALHGIQGTRASWQRVMQATTALQQPVRWVLPHLRGRGQAPRPAGPDGYTLEAMAQDLAQALDTAVPAGAPYLLAGWSLGVSVALAALARERIRRPHGLLLVSGSPALCETRWFEGEGAALDEAIVARRMRMGLREHADDAAVRWNWEAVRGTDQRALLPALRGLRTQVLHGSEDADCPLAHGRCLAEGLNAPLQVCQGVGHALLNEAPAAVAQALDLLCKETR